MRPGYSGVHSPGLIEASIIQPGPRFARTYSGVHSPGLIEAKSWSQRRQPCAQGIPGFIAPASLKLLDLPGKLLEALRIPGFIAPASLKRMADNRHLKACAAYSGVHSPGLIEALESRTANCHRRWAYSGVHSPGLIEAAASAASFSRISPYSGVHSPGLIEAQSRTLNSFLH